MKSKLLLGLLAVTLLAGCDRVDPNSPLGKRQVLFEEMLRTSEDLGGMLRGRLAFNPQRFAQGAQQLDELSRQPWQHFPQIAESERSSAKPEVWQEQQRFQQLARELEAATGALAAASAQQPLVAEAMAPLVQRVEDSCEACHKAFRAY